MLDKTYLSMANGIVLRRTKVRDLCEMSRQSTTATSTVYTIAKRTDGAKSDSKGTPPKGEGKLKCEDIVRQKVRE